MAPLLQKDFRMTLQDFLTRSARFGRKFVSCSLPALALLALTFALAGCSDFEHAAYTTLAVTQAEYEVTQDQMADAAARGLIDGDQWNQFAAAAHHFIDAHNAAVDAFQLWSHSKSPNDQARLQAMLNTLPQLIREINDLVASFTVQQPKATGQSSGSAELRFFETLRFVPFT